MLLACGELREEGIHRWAYPMYGLTGRRACAWGVEAASPSRVRTTPHRSGREIAPNDLPVCLYAGARARCSARCVTGSAVVSGCVTLTVTLTLCVCVSEPPHTPQPQGSSVQFRVQLAFRVVLQYYDLRIHDTQSRCRMCRIILIRKGAVVGMSRYLRYTGWPPHAHERRRTHGHPIHTSQTWMESHPHRSSGHRPTDPHLG